MHGALEPLVVIHGIVLGAAIIPKGEGAMPPAKAAGELWPDLVLEEVVEQRPALLLRPTLEVRCMGLVDVKHLASSLRVRANHRMQCL